MTQATATGTSETWFDQDLGLFDNNGIDRPAVLETYGLGNGPDGQPNAQIQKYLSLVEAGQSAGLTPMARSVLAGISLQGFLGLQVKKDISVTQVQRPGLDERELESRESADRLHNQQMDRAEVEINFNQQDIQEPPPPGPAPAPPHRSFVYDPHHIEFNVGFFASAGTRFGVTTAVTREVNSSLEVPVWQQGVMGV